MTTSLPFLAVILHACAAAAAAEALVIDVPSGGSKCLTEDLHRGALSHASYRVAPGPTSAADPRISARVTGPRGEELYLAEAAERGEFRFRAAEDGGHTALPPAGARRGAARRTTVARFGCAEATGPQRRTCSAPSAALLLSSSAGAWVCRADTEVTGGGCLHGVGGAPLALACRARRQATAASSARSSPASARARTSSASPSPLPTTAAAHAAARLLSSGSGPRRRPRSSPHRQPHQATQACSPSAGQPDRWRSSRAPVPAPASRSRGRRRPRRRRGAGSDDGARLPHDGTPKHVAFEIQTPAAPGQTLEI